MKKCSKCNFHLDLRCFYKRAISKDGLSLYCKSCSNKIVKEWTRVNKEKSTKIKLKWQDKNLDKHSDYNKKHRLQNKEAYLKYRKEYNKKDLPNAVARLAKRRGKKLKATPNWLTKEHCKQMTELYKLTKELQWLSEDQLVVDHIIPLQNKNVCGLHVPWNLQILGWDLNGMKSNQFDFTYDNNSWRNND